MSTIKQFAVAALALPVLFTGVASAAAAGQVEGGDIYRVRNVTKNTAFTDPATADKCETVQFKVRVHNPGPDSLEGVNVKATLDQTVVGTSHSSKVTITATNDAAPESTTDTAGVNLSTAQKLTYENGSTELLDANGAKLTTLGDTILTSGVAITDGVGVSTQQKRFVQFSAKVDCPTPPVVTPPTTTTTTTPPAPVKPAAPAVLPNTGAGDVAAVAGVAAAAGLLGYRRFLSRRLSA